MMGKMARISPLLLVASAAVLVGTGGHASGREGIEERGVEQEAGGSGWIFPPFRQAMGDREIQWGWWSEDDRRWVDQMERLYDTSLRSRERETMKRRGSRGGEEGDRGWQEEEEEEEGEQGLGGIPRIMHQIWLGGSPLPDQFEKWRQTCFDTHPDWKHILWTEEEADLVTMVDREAYDKAENVGAKSDILRREVIYRFGGLYLDTDFECLSSFEPLHERLDFFASLSNVGSIEVSNGIFAASKRHPIVHNLLTTRPESLPPPKRAAQLDWVGMPTIVASGPGHFTRVVMRSLEKEGVGRVAILPTLMVFPLPNSVVSLPWEARESERHSAVRPESIAVHHWASSWLKREMGVPLWDHPLEGPTASGRVRVLDRDL